MPNDQAAAPELVVDFGVVVGFAVPEVDGALVGGASLKVDDFSPIITALESA